MPRRVDTALMLAIAIVATLFRVLSSPDLANDHYMHMASAQQLLFGELPGRDFVDPGMPLTHILSALAQLLNPGPFSETLLSASLLGLAAAVTYMAGTWLSGSRLVGFAAAAIDVLLATRLYSYPKVLVPAIALLLITAYCTSASTRRLALLGAWTTIGGLLRHDLGVYVAAGATCMLLTLHWGTWRALARATGIYAAATTITVLPYLLYLQWAEGIGEHLRRSQEFVRTDEHQRVLLTPEWTPLAGGWTLSDSYAFLYYLAHVALLALALLLIARRGAPKPLRAAAAGAAGILAMYLLVVLRYPIEARLADIASALTLAIAAAYGLVAVRSSVPGPRSSPATASRAAMAVLIAGTALAAADAGRFLDKLDTTRAYGGLGAMRRHYLELERRGTVWPWSEAWPEREMPPAIEYINACTAPSDALLLTWPAPHYSFFARRQFAAGHGMLLPPHAFTTEQDQQQMLLWLVTENVPIVLINDSRDAEFTKAYPQLAAWVRERYAPVGEFVIYDDSHITVGMRRDLTATSSWGPDAWPCPHPSR